MSKTLGPRALRDIRAGMESRRFRVGDAATAVYITGGALLGAISGVVEGRLGPETEELHAEAVLRVLGLSVSDAARVARLRMGETD